MLGGSAGAIAVLLVTKFKGSVKNLVSVMTWMNGSVLGKTVFVTIDKKYGKKDG